MSYTKTATLWCDWETEDGHSCSEWTKGTGQFRTITPLRHWARKRGWNVNLPGGKDLCPEHANKSNQL